MPHKTKAERSLAASIAANTRWSDVEDRTAATAPARRALERKFEDQVDPERALDPAERAKRVANARRAHYQRLALAAVKARKAKKAS